jgi:hypothetical protein
METAAGATQRKIHYSLHSSGGLVPSQSSASAGTVQDVSYVDIFKDLSLCNHRLYRQGRVPMVRIGTIGPFGNPSTLAVVAQPLPNTWPVRKAHQLALKEYLRATKEERRRTGQARWHDFKVWYDDGMRTGNHTLSPLGITTGNSEWPYSEIAEADDSTERRFKFIGSTDGNAFGMVAEYDSAADQQDDVPDNPGSTTPYENLNPDVQNANTDNLLDEGDAPPYNPENLQVSYPQFMIAQGTGKSDQLVSPWFPAPCGLIKLTAAMTFGSDNTSDDAVGGFFVEVAPGDYKGIHATPMGLKL